MATRPAILTQHLAFAGHDGRVVHVPAGRCLLVGAGAEARLEWGVAVEEVAAVSGPLLEDLLSAGVLVFLRASRRSTGLAA
jgi:hypothetical protein